ncbi:unnamed protein product [Meloidogyne enterolobii]|uniref:Uncharacterized protein n=2 Tax=Meloidogyne enterolobii TaxID=390850 RepID=A0ACB1B2J0_MELEN|nr:unnamed protein product [Meloidogyne enterolobii]
MRTSFHRIRGFILLLFSIFPFSTFEAEAFGLFAFSFSFSSSNLIISSSFSIFGSLTNSIFGIFSFFNPLIFIYLKYYF